MMWTSVFIAGLIFIIIVLVVALISARIRLADVTRQYRRDSDKDDKSYDTISKAYRSFVFNTYIVMYALRLKHDFSEETITVDKSSVCDGHAHDCMHSILNVINDKLGNKIYNRLQKED